MPVSYTITSTVAFLLTIPFVVPLRAQEAPAEPRALVDDVRIERFGDAPPRAVRLVRDPVSNDFICITFEGEVYRIRRTTSREPKNGSTSRAPENGRSTSSASEYVLISTPDDHGITRELQGLAVDDSTLYLTGNVPVNDGYGTKGRMVRGRLQPDGSRTWSTVFMTEEFGTVRTAFDHGFNATVLSPDKQFLYVTSGSRTDHGEVQDNDGRYPGARDAAFTAAVLRIPADAENLILPDDADALMERGYLFARGIRNAYDLAFSPTGHLFAVSNSSDYDHPEDMFWIREGHHYGFPWTMGGIENPQQYPDFEPDPDEDSFLNPYSHAYSVGYFHNDPDFPAPPPGIEFTPPVANVGPDANYYRDPETGHVKKGDETGRAVATFTAHRSPLGLVFDVDSALAPPYRGDGFMLSWTNGARSVLMGRLSDLGEDLMHLTLTYSPEFDNYMVQAVRIAEGFNGPVDALLVDNDMYVLEHGGSQASIWKVTFPESTATRAD